MIGENSGQNALITMVKQHLVSITVWIQKILKNNPVLVCLYV